MYIFVIKFEILFYSDAGCKLAKEEDLVKKANEYRKTHNVPPFDSAATSEVSKSVYI